MEARAVMSRVAGKQPGAILVQGCARPNSGLIAKEYRNSMTFAAVVQHELQNANE